jgi:hypothetical protein
LDLPEKKSQTRHSLGNTTYTFLALLIGVLDITFRFAFAVGVPIGNGSKSRQPEDSKDHIHCGEGIWICVLSGLGEAGGHGEVDERDDGDEALLKGQLM